jgi:hypothetical protein
MIDFNLKEFLKNYKPKKIENDLLPYIKCNKLKSYILLTHQTKQAVIPQNTYIKYIKINDAFKDNNYADHIKCGGILLAGGKINKGKFSAIKDNMKWTHLMLKLQSSDKDFEENNIGEYIFIIKIIDYYIFYRIFNTNDFRNTIIELKKNMLK